MPTRDARRRFNARERAALLIAAAGRCSKCDGELDPDFHADHRDAWSRGGQTDVINGQALCPTCNRRKSDRQTPAPPMGPDQAATNTVTAGAVTGSAQRNPARAHEPAGAGHGRTPECHKEIS